MKDINIEIAIIALVVCALVLVALITFGLVTLHNWHNSPLSVEKRVEYKNLRKEWYRLDENRRRDARERREKEALWRNQRRYHNYQQDFKAEVARWERNLDNYSDWQYVTYSRPVEMTQRELDSLYGDAQ